ncbi:MAG TPA: ATP-dependent sacrificial sulfur transferase LarE [Candidatus Methanomethylicus sp.]|nr:ATP-dependent sacrificial sulfur transferase LarE [Candidatus Methanomethylicus sp.]
MSEGRSRYEDLKGWFNGKRVAVAFSGGVDSTVVALAAHEGLGEDAAAFTAETIFSSGGDIEVAKAVAGILGIRHFVVQVRLPKRVASNPPDRCYLCKKTIMRSIKRNGRMLGFDMVVDGTNMDDMRLDRPGIRAIMEAGIRSPLAELGIGKAEVREMLKQRGLEHDRPSSPCAATRFPVGEKITPEGVRTVNEAESFIKGLGFRQVRVRVHGNMARIELDPPEIGRMTNEKLRSAIVGRLRGLGFDRVALDMEGYSTGPMDAAEVSRRDKRSLW